MYESEAYLNYFLQLSLYQVCSVLLDFSKPQEVHADSNDWVKGASIQPEWYNDYASSNYQQTIKNLVASGATYVGLVIPYYQQNINTTAMYPGNDTPTDAALVQGIETAHAAGLKVLLKPHIQSQDNVWRANINPVDRQSWFNSYTQMLTHYAQIAQANHVEMYMIGTELVDMADPTVNPTNTQNWETMIATVRKNYTGILTYDADRNEKDHIQFWPMLDYASVSVYYALNTSSEDVQSLTQAWAVDAPDLINFQAQILKPLLFGEVGYRSVTNAHLTPWDYQMTGSADDTEQANDYQAMFSTFVGKPGFAGMFLWDWQINPNAGGSNDTDYTPQNKPALGVITAWFKGTAKPTIPTLPYSFSSIASISNSPEVNNQSTITTNVSASGGPLVNGIIDAEIFNSKNQQVAQKYFDNQTIQTNDSQTYTIPFTPTIADTYRVSLGIFTNNWNANPYWQNNELTFIVQNVPIITTPPIVVSLSPVLTPATPIQSGVNSTPTTSQNSTINVWWPSNGGPVSGVQPFKAMLTNMDVKDYQMFWQVDGGSLNAMQTNTTDYPHKEALVDLSGWNWQAAGQYIVTFIAKNSSGAVITTQNVKITVTH